MKNFHFGFGFWLMLVSFGAVGIFLWFAIARQTAPDVPEGDTITRRGLHWHPELAIFVKGEKQEIPANLGIGAVHQPMHTHDSSGIIHLEFQGSVRKQDLTLGQFFKNWGKDMRSFGANMAMTVNGAETAEYENYSMRDKDVIELRFE